MTAADSLAKPAAGLVVMLDSAGRTIAELELRIGLLEESVAGERARVVELEEQLATILATRDLPPDENPPGQDGAHDLTTPPPARGETPSRLPDTPV